MYPFFVEEMLFKFLSIVQLEAAQVVIKGRRL